MGGKISKFRSPKKNTALSNTSNNTGTSTTVPTHKRQQYNNIAGNKVMDNGNNDQRTKLHVKFVLRRGLESGDVENPPENFGQSRFKKDVDLELSNMQNIVKSNGGTGENYLRVPTEANSKYRSNCEMDIELRILTVLLCYMSDKGWLDLSKIGCPGNNLAYQLFEQNTQSHVHDIYFLRLDFDKLPEKLKELYSDIKQATSKMFEAMKIHKDDSKWAPYDRLFKAVTNTCHIRTEGTKENSICGGMFITPRPQIKEAGTLLHPDIFDQIFREPWTAFGIGRSEPMDFFNDGKLYDWTVCIPEKYLTDKTKTEEIMFNINN